MAMSNRGYGNYYLAKRMREGQLAGETDIEVCRASTI
jgi:hypothetical protein